MVPLPSVQLYRDGVVGTIHFSVDINPQGFHAQKTSVGRSLRIPIAVRATNGGRLLSLQGTFGFPGENGGVPIPAQVFSPYDGYLDVPLTDEQFARIERTRDGQEPMFDIRLRGVAIIGDEHCSVDCASNGAIVAVPRDKWLWLLEQLDASKRRLIELPSPPKGDGPWARVPDHIAKAARRLASGDPGGSMVETRAAVECLLEAVGAEIGRPREVEDKAVANYATAVAAIIQKAHVDRSDDPYFVVAGAIRLIYDTFGYASETHNGLDHIERLNAELALSQRLLSTPIRLGPACVRSLRRLSKRTRHWNILQWKQYVISSSSLLAA